MPGFWVAVMLVLLLSVKFRLPVAGWYIEAYVLPVGTMVFLLPGMMHLVRSSMLDVLDSEYIKLAGIKDYRKIIWKHALRNTF